MLLLLLLLLCCAAAAAATAAAAPLLRAPAPANCLAPFHAMGARPLQCDDPLTTARLASLKGLEGTRFSALPYPLKGSP